MAAAKKTTAAKEVAAKVADTKTDEVKTAKEAPAAKTEIAEEVKKAAGGICPGWRQKGVYQIIRKEVLFHA